MRRQSKNLAKYPEVQTDAIWSVDLIRYFEKAINQVRKDPKSVIPFLEARKFINNDEFTHTLVPNIRYKTQQGTRGVEEAISFLGSLQPAEQLILSPSLCQAAYLCGKGMAQMSMIQDTQTFLPEITKKLRQLGVQNIDRLLCIVEYGFRKDPEIIPSIIVNDGDPSRQQRDLLMDVTTKYLGIGVHQHSEFDYMIMILLTDKMEEPTEKAGCKCQIF